MTRDRSRRAATDTIDPNTPQVDVEWPDPSPLTDWWKEILELDDAVKQRFSRCSAGPQHL